MDRLTKRDGLLVRSKFKGEYGSQTILHALADYEDAEEQGLLVRLPIPTNERIKYIAKMLGVELYEEFKIKTTKYGKLLGTKEIDRVFRFDSELVYKGYNDGWSEWYGFDCDKILYYLLLGKYEIIKEEAEAKLKEMESE